MKQPATECSRYERCAVNACPLHTDYLTLKGSPLDAETVCKASRAQRERIAARYPGVLPMGGMKKREHGSFVGYRLRAKPVENGLEAQKKRNKSAYRTEPVEIGK